jgi:hypothetical protein
VLALGLGQVLPGLGAALGQVVEGPPVTLAGLAIGDARDEQVELLAGVELVRVIHNAP